MARLQSRSKYPPDGFQFLQPQISPNVLGGEGFDECVSEVLRLRRANPFITQQNNLSLDVETVQNEVDEYNAARCLANPDWAHFVADTSPPKTWSPSISPRPRRSAGVVAGARRTVAGIRLVTDWLGTGLRPVEHELAEKRSAVCAGCPQNGQPDWLQKIDAAVAVEIKSLVEIKNDLKLSTSQDEKLLTCQACDCYLKLKVHAPFEHILNTLKPEVKVGLDPRCWVLHEGQSTTDG